MKSSKILPAVPAPSREILDHMTAGEVLQRFVEGDPTIRGDMDDYMADYRARKAARGAPVPCAQFGWCDAEHDELDDIENLYHCGIAVTATSGLSSIDLDRWQDNDGSGYSFSINEWKIDPADAAREIADLRSIIDQFEAAMTAAVADSRARADAE